MSSKIVIMKNSRYFIGNALLFPRNPDKEVEKIFYFKYLLLLFSSFGHVLGATLHFIKNARERNFINADLDIALMVSLLGCYYFLLCYLKNIKNTIKLYQLFSDFDSYGKPPEFETRNKELNKYSVIHYVYITIAVGGITLAPLIEQRWCERDNVEKNLHEVCGILGFAWWPFDFSSFKHYYYGYQIFSSYIIYHTSSVVSFSVMETVEHLIIRLKHVRAAFEEALKEEDYWIRMEKFKVNIRYHNEVIKMSQIMNESFVLCMFVHVLLTGAILGCVGYRLMTTFSLGSICLYIGWAISMIMVCYSGQRLIKESTAVGDAVYNFHWYNLDNSLQRDIMLVIIRSQKSLYLEAGPFGTMTYPLMMTIMKTSYSYLTLLNRTS